MEFEPVIGLEVHAQLKTRTKIFCACSTGFGAPPNTHICPVCLGMPGVLPVLNRAVVDYALRMALATGCTIARESRFARKNYFYPDLPKGYQISQYELPIAEHGEVEIEVGGARQRIRIRRIHMEEDAGKLNHDPHRPASMVDLNRAGVPLIEIVSEPDIGSAEAAGAYLRQLRTIVRYLGVCDGNLEEGSFRCDANVSIRPRGATALGTRAELKNLNSFRFVEKAIDYEISRQKEVLLDGGVVAQETRLWDADRNQTFSMRGKEEAHDYRYFPDPDLLPLVIDEGWIETVRRSLPELPEARKARFVEQHGLPIYDAGILTSDRELADYFEACLQAFPHPKPISNWIMGALLGLLNAQGVPIGQAPIPAAALAGLLQLVDTGAISAKTAKTVFDEMAASGKSAQAIVAEKGLAQISDTGAIETVIQNVLAGHPREVESYRGGKTKLMGFFVGEVMKATRGQANPKAVNELLRKMRDLGRAEDAKLNTLVGDHMNKFKTAFIAVLLIIMPISVFAAAKTVVILPFKVNAEKDMSFLRDGVYDMLSTRLAKEGEVEVLNRQTVEKALPSTVGPLTEGAGREIGRKLSADYVLFGSLTVLGNSISLDAKVVDVAGAKPTMSFFEQSEDAGGIISRINAMAAAVNEKMFGRTTAIAQPAPAAAAPQAQASQPAPADPYAHPEKMLKQPSGSGGGAGSPFAASEESAREFSPQFWKSAAYKLAFNGIALGDVDGDGKTETVVITADKVIVFRYEQQRFYQVTEYEAESKGINIGVDVADINGNGMPEIIVTRLALTRKTLSSFALEWDGKAFERIVDNAHWYFRVCDLPDRGKVLLGQEPRFGSPFKGKIFEMIWRNGHYEPETPVAVSTAANVLGLTIGQIVKGQRESIAAYDPSDRIRVLDEAGKEEWKSSERYGGSTLYYLGAIDDQGDTERPIYLPMRLLTLKPDKDGKSQVLAVRNFDIAGGKLEKFRSFSEAQIIGFGWDGLGLQPEWRTRKMTGCIRDFAFGDFDNDGELEMVCALVLDEGRIITTIPKSMLIALKFK